MRRKSGFTLVEIIVVVTFLVLIAGMLGPNLAAFQDGQRIKSYLLNVRSLAMDGRETAFRTGSRTVMRYEDGEGFILEAVQSDATSERTQVRTVRSDRTPAPDRFIAGGSERGSGDWELSFYPDGRSDGGGVHFDLGGEGTSLVVNPRTGRSTIEAGAIPDFADDEWSAGDYERRS